MKYLWRIATEDDLQTMPNLDDKHAIDNTRKG